MATRLVSVAENESVIATGNMTDILCVDSSKIVSTNLWLNGNPFNGTTNLFLFQLSSISMVSLLIDVCLKPLGQSSLVSQIVGGMIFGPTFLGYNTGFSDMIFPKQSTTTLSTFATFGIMFFHFTIGVKMDPVLMVRPGRQAAIIGSSALIVTLASSILFALVLKKFLTINTTLNSSLPLVALSQSLTGYPVVATLLAELKILNTDVGRLALSSSLFADLIGNTMLPLVFSLKQSEDSIASGFFPSMLCIVAFVASIFLILRPRLIKMYYQTGETRAVDETSIAFIFVLVMISGFLSEVIGQHYVFGPLLLGLAVPDGPPLGAAISARIDTLARAFLYPTFCAVSGVQTNFFAVDFQSLYIVGIVVVFAFVIKLVAVVLPALFFSVPRKEAFALGLILNAKGIIELTLYNLWKDGQLIGDQVFTLVMMSVVMVTAIVTPMIRMLYDPSQQYVSLKRSTIHHAKRDSELRILVCIHNHESVPTIMDILEVSHPSKQNPIAVIAMVLVELVGRSTPVLVTNQNRGVLQTNSSFTSSKVLNALSQYEERNKGYATVQSYTSISYFQTMHDDVCRIAFEKLAHIVIVPFHKQWAIDGEIGSSSRPIQNLNIKVLEKAPCSVGILVDRGILSGFVSFLTSPTKFRVTVLFIGGPDDMESLAYGCRMVKHETVYLTVVRFLLFGDEHSKDRKNDSHVINEYRQENVGNDRFVYEEKVLRDGLGLSSYIIGSVNDYHLILVGKYHPDSPLLDGLSEWSECPELGVVGDMLASPDFKTTATVLVIQQQRVAGRLLNHNLPYVVRDRNSLAAADDLPKQMLRQESRNDSFSISMDDFDTF